MRLSLQSGMWGRLSTCAPIVNRRTRGACRAFLLLALTSTFIYPQIVQPSLGFVRDRVGRVRILRGVAGSFIVGQPVLDAADECWFDGRRGVARITDALVTFNATGEITGKAARMPAITVATIEGDEIVITATSARLRMPFAPDRIERAGADYIVVSTAGSRVLVRITRGKEQIFDLPEPAE